VLLFFIIMSSKPAIGALVGEPKLSVNSDGSVGVQNTNRFQAVVAGGSVPVRDGKWYYEVRCVSGTPLIGWAIAGYQKNLSSGSSGEVYYGDIAKELHGGRSKVRVSRRSVNEGDIIGCLIDFDEKCVLFSHNGMFLSESLRSLSLSYRGGYIPVFELGGRCKISVSIRESDFCVELPNGTNGYRTAIDGPKKAPSASADALSKIFDQYVTSGDKCEGEQLQNLFTAVGSASDLDPIVFVFLWFVNVKIYAWEVQREAFVNAFSAARCSTLADIQHVLRKQQSMLEDHSSDTWNKYYMFVFHLLRGASSMVQAQTACEVWKMFGFGKWKFFEKFSAFLEEKQTEKEEEVAKRPPTAKQIPPELIGLDAWESFPEFMASFPKSFDDYDPLDLGYNSLFDDFVESLKD